MKQEAVLIERKNVADTLRINPSEFVPLPELFEDICKLKTKEEKNNLISLYITTNPTNKELLKNYIQSVYHPMVILDLPSEVPPYVSDFPDYEMAPTALNKALLRIKEKGSPALNASHIKIIRPIDAARNELTLMVTLATNQIAKKVKVVWINENKII